MVLLINNFFIFCSYKKGTKYTNMNEIKIDINIPNNEDLDPVAIIINKQVNKINTLVGNALKRHLIFLKSNK